MTQERPSWFLRGQAGLLLECLVWAFVVAAIYAGIATFSDWRRFEPETFDDYWFIISHRWDFVPDYLAWIGLPLIVIVWIHSRFGIRPGVPTRHSGDEYRIFDLPPWRPRSSIETFVYLYLGAMVMAGLGRFAMLDEGRMRLLHMVSSPAVLDHIFDLATYSAVGGMPCRG